jgi:hypothetical protein
MRFLVEFWRSMTTAYSWIEKMIKAATAIVSFLAVVGLVIWKPEWAQRSLTLPLAALLFLPLLVFVSYHAGIARMKIQRPTLRIGRIKPSTDPAWPILFLPVKNLGPGSITPFVYILRVRDIWGKIVGFYEPVEARWANKTSGNKEPYPFLQQYAETEAYVFYIFLVGGRPDGLALYTIDEIASLEHMNPEFKFGMPIQFALSVGFEDEQEKESSIVELRYLLVPDRKSLIGYKAKKLQWYSFLWILYWRYVK